MLYKLSHCGYEKFRELLIARDIDPQVDMDESGRPDKTFTFSTDETFDRHHRTHYLTPVFPILTLDYTVIDLFAYN